MHRVSKTMDSMPPHRNQSFGQVHWQHLGLDRTLVLVHFWLALFLVVRLDLVPKEWNHFRYVIWLCQLKLNSSDSKQLEIKALMSCWVDWKVSIPPVLNKPFLVRQFSSFLLSSPCYYLLDVWVWFSWAFQFHHHHCGLSKICSQFCSSKFARLNWPMVHYVCRTLYLRLVDLVSPKRTCLNSSSHGRLYLKQRLILIRHIGVSWVHINTIDVF